MRKSYLLGIQLHQIFEEVENIHNQFIKDIFQSQSQACSKVSYYYSHF